MKTYYGSCQFPANSRDSSYKWELQLAKTISLTALIRKRERNLFYEYKNSESSLIIEDFSNFFFQVYNESIRRVSQIKYLGIITNKREVHTRIEQVRRALPEREKPFRQNETKYESETYFFIGCLTPRSPAIIYRQRSYHQLLLKVERLWRVQSVPWIDFREDELLSLSTTFSIA